MADLPTEIFRKNLLLPSTRKIILQAEPRNRSISFTPPDMDRKMWLQMSRSSKEHDKDIRRLMYRFSSVLRPLDNSLRFVYASKPDDSATKEVKEAWILLEQTVLNSRALLLDALSFGNEIRREQALKSIVPDYKKPSEKEEVFGEDLSDIIQHENETNKLFNDASWQRRRAAQTTSTRTNNTTFLNFKPPPATYTRGRGKVSNWQPHF